MREPTGDKTKQGKDLHICPECGSDLVQPTFWEQAGDRAHWRVWRRCPECEWFCQGVHGEDAIDAFDEQLDLGTEELLGDLTLLTRANMEEQVDRFVTALNAGWIVPEDF